MNDEQKRQYLERYEQAKESGGRFFPDVLFKDAVVSMLVFLALLGLAYFVGAPLEERANPADTSYTPRPEWYFLFLFQLLKYFPGQLEVIGVFVLPTILIALLFALPFLDRGAQRSPTSRPIVVGATAVLILGVGLLTVQAVLEAPPPASAEAGDQVAALYARNCAVCHGAAVQVSPGTDLHAVIAEGSHDGMPAWSGDLTSDQIDALAGFILFPGGSRLFSEYCQACHEISDLVASDPFELRSSLDQGLDYPAHADVDVPAWTEVLSRDQRSDLLNFLAAPDGRRLFAVNCSSCHGSAVAFSGGREELLAIIQQGGLHLEMPPWRGRLTDSEMDILAQYVVNPESVDGAALFSQNCSSCHGSRIPAASDVDAARLIIARGGAHETMPVWGSILTPDQINALVVYTIEASRGAPVEVGQRLFSQNCAVCHGEFGEGGPNPGRADDVIAPISSAEYLGTRDDITLRAIISAGQPNFGMSPFGATFGGPLSGEEIDSIVSFLRSWEANPPVELPPEIRASSLSASGAEIYAEVCAQCHGPDGDGLIGGSLQSPEFQAAYTDQEMFDTINLGHEATAMIGWGEILTSDQIEQLVSFIRKLPGAGGQAGPVSFAGDVLPLLTEECGVCHGTLGGWDASSYKAVMETGDNAPVVLPGDADGSLLAQKLLGTHTTGAIMPPSGKLPAFQIQIILDWILAGAPDN